MRKLTQKSDLSIIVPVHNSEHTIEKCVESLIHQNRYITEIILVENNSTDKSKEICERISVAYSNVHTISTKKIGVSNARNIGIENASGEYITFCDADDYWDFYSYDLILKKLKEYDADIAVTGYKTVLDNGDVIATYGVVKNYIVDYESFIEDTLTSIAVNGYCWNRIYHRDIINEIRFRTDLSVMEDSFFNIEVALSDIKLNILYLNCSGYNYVVNPSSVTKNASNLFVGDECKYYLVTERIEQEFNLSDRIKKACRVNKAISCSTISYRLRKICINNKKIKKRNAKKRFWSNIFPYIFCTNIPIKEKFKSIIKNVLW